MELSISDSKSRSMRIAICGLLQEIGTNAKAAVDVLKTLLGSEDAFYAARALWFISRDADLVVPHLVAMYDEHQEEICDLCCDMGVSARLLVPQVLNTLSGEDWDPQWAAADAIGHIAAGDENLLPALMEAFDHESPLVRSAIARSIAKIGRPVLPVLMARAQSDHLTQKTWAIYALGKMGAIAATAAPIIIANLDSKNKSLASTSAIALAHVSGDPRALPVLIRVLTVPDDDAPIEAAIEALGVMGAVAAEATPLLDHLAMTLNGSSYGDAAALALQRIEGVQLQ
jgi:HEAT repeat protein